MTADAVLDQLARRVATGECVWFIGSGFSYESDLPRARDLALEMLKCAMAPTDGVDEQEQIEHYNEAKSLLLGSDYPDRCPLQKQHDRAGVETELQLITAASKRGERPFWIDLLLHLGRLSDLLYRMPIASHADRDVRLARWMGMDDKAKWRGKLTKGHLLLGLLMKEGLVTQVITTNYDGLLERAWARVGLGDAEVVRNATEYAQKGGRPDTVYLYKIHGCQEAYCEAKPPVAQREAAGLLVVTDRQLQDWRDQRWDWAQGVFQDRLRHRPFLFVGFSGNDAVLQATLNAMAEELHETQPEPGQMTIVPELSFPFYQFLSLYGGKHKPAEYVLPLYGSDLLRQLYPAVMKAYFVDQAALSAVDLHRLQETARARFDCKDDAALDISIASARRLLGTSAEFAAQKTTESHLLSGPILSPGQRLFRDLRGNAAPDYIPLQDQVETYQKTVQLMALWLIQRYADQAVMQKLDVNIEWLGEYATLLIGLADMSVPPVRLVLVPGFWLDQPKEHLATAIRNYLTLRRGMGGGYSGRLAFLYPAWVPAEQMKDLWEVGVVPALHGAATEAEILSAAGYFCTEGGATHVS